MFVCVVSLSQPSSRDLLYVKCLCVLSRYLSPVVGICYMLNVCVCCLVITAQQKRSVISQMFVCVVSLSQPSSSDLLYVKCLCMLSRYHSPVTEICYMLNVCVCVLSRYLSPVVEICYMLNVCVCCLVISAQ